MGEERGRSEPGAKHAYQCFHPKQLQPCTLHEPACGCLESLSLSVISLRQLLHPLAYKENFLWERNTCSQMEGGHGLFLSKTWTLSMEKNTWNGAERQTWQIKKFYSWCWHHFTRQLGPYSENLKTSCQVMDRNMVSVWPSSPKMLHLCSKIKNQIEMWAAYLNADWLRKVNSFSSSLMH